MFLDIFLTIVSNMSETYLERSKKMSWMVLNMSRTTLKKFDFFEIFPIFRYFLNIFVQESQCHFCLENNWNEKDAGGLYDQFGGGERPWALLCVGKRRIPFFEKRSLLGHFWPFLSKCPNVDFFFGGGRGATTTLRRCDVATLRRCDDDKSEITWPLPHHTQGPNTSWGTPSLWLVLKMTG